MKYMICFIAAIVDQVIDNTLWMHNDGQPMWMHGPGAFVIRIILNIVLWELSVYLFVINGVFSFRRALSLYARFEWNVPDDL